MKLFRGELLLVVANIFFAVLAVIGRVGMNVSLPLWTGATSKIAYPNCTSNSSLAAFLSSNGGINASSPPTMDPFFVLSFSALFFVILFGCITLALAAVQLTVNKLVEKPKLQFITVEDDLLFPQWQLLLIGIFSALNGLFVVFASLPSRTAPFLQAILGNFSVPLTILFR